MIFLCHSKNFKWKVHKLVLLLTFIASVVQCAVKIERNPLSDSILHFETLNYPKEYLSLGHSRVRRSLNPHEELELNFHAHNRKFELRLRRDLKLFSGGLGFDDHGSFHPSNIYEGHLKDDPKSRVHGFLFDGIFEGVIHRGDGSEYQVESAKQYKHLDHGAFHSVIYDVKDIMHPKRHVCGGVMAGTRDWMDKQVNRSSWKETDYVKYESHKPNNFDESIMNPEVHHRQRRATFDRTKKECRLLVRADYTFSIWAGGDDRAMYLMTQYVKSVSHIYESTSFDGDAIPDGITLNIKRISVIPKTGCNTATSECQFAQLNIGVEKFLDIASLDNHDEYCLSYVFAHRDFADGVLGLAWIGDTAGAGGICDRHQSIGGTKKSLNTGIVTNLNYGNTMPSKVVEITFAHEVGHNFGSKHDPLSGECAPGGSSGNFIMYPRATSGTEKNNYDFSSCSKAFVWPVLQAKSATCFRAQGDPICGNRIKETGEDCDCGYAGEDSCNKDTCCTPSDPKAKTGCTFSAKADQQPANLRCSSSLGFCCDTNTCGPYSNAANHKCRDMTGCAAVSYCVDTAYTCPNSTLSPDLTKCNNDSNVCIKGECTGSLCLEQGQEECQCSVEADSCKVCCQEKNITSTCKALNDKMLPSGSPCDNYAGYCDFLSKCRKVDAEGPLARLKKFLFSSQTFDNILDWMKTYWWACVLIGLGLVLFMAAFITCCSVHTPSSNPNKPPPRHLSLPRTISRRNKNNAGPSAPPSNQHAQRGGGGGGGYHRQPPQGNHPPDYIDDGLPGYNTALRQPPSYEMR